MTAPTPAALDGKNLETLIRDLRPFAAKPVGSIRIDMEDVRSILALAVQIETLTADLAEARLAAGLGCDAANGGAHSIVTDGRYQFCHRCGETVRTPTLSERARQAEARALSADTARAAAEADRDQWREAHTREYEARIATEMEQSAAVSARAAAEAALAEAREALRPFARHGDYIAEHFADHGDDVICGGLAEDPITIGDFRRASAALEQKP